MPSKKSYFNKTIFRKSFKRCWPVWVTYFLFLLGALSIQLYLNCLRAREGWAKKEAQVQEAFYMMDLLNNEILLFGVLAVSIAAVLIVYSYLFSQRSSNMMHAFPLSRQELFWSNYLAGLLTIFLPQFFMFFITMLVGFLEEVPQVECIAYLFVILIGEGFIFYSMAVFSAMFTGQIAAVPFFFVGFNYFYVGVRYIINHLVMSVSYGMNRSLSLQDNEIGSPLYCIQKSVRFDSRAYWTGQVEKIEVYGMQYIAIYVAVAAGLTLFSFFLYKKRILENAGNLVCISRLKPWIRWGIALFGGELGAVIYFEFIEIAEGPLQIIFMIMVIVVIGSFVFFVIEMLMEKTTQVFQKKRFLEVFAISVILVLNVAVIKKDVMGLEDWMPKVNDVQRAYIVMYEPVLCETSDEIQKVLNFHKEMIDDKPQILKQKKQEDRKKTITFKYFMKDGTVHQRNYTVYPKEKISFLEKSPTNRVSRTLYDIYKMTTQKRHYLQSRFCRDYDKILVTGGDYGHFIENDEESHNIQLSAEQAKRVLKAYEKDMDRGAICRMPNDVDESNQKAYIDYWYQDYLEINFYVTNTKDYPENLGADFDSLQEDDGYFDSQNDIGLLSLNKACVNTLKVLRDEKIITKDMKLLPDDYMLEEDSLDE